jgi:hypothetical protein
MSFRFGSGVRECVQRVDADVLTGRMAFDLAGAVVLYR